MLPHWVPAVDEVTEGEVDGEAVGDSPSLVPGYLEEMELLRARQLLGNPSTTLQNLERLAEVD